MSKDSETVKVSKTRRIMSFVDGDRVVEPIFGGGIGR
jgi:hypothetical protein